jgi:V/A-type H+-transporting ATPase subunit I
MSFSLLLGFIQILVAMTVQVIVRIRQGGFANGLMPISYIMMLFGMLIWGAHSNAFSLNIGEFAVGNWKLGPLLLALPLAAGQALLLGGIAIVLACNNPGKKFFLRPLLGLWELYNYAAGILGDILSYIRLFALGLCGGLLGSTFNALALGFIKKGDAVEIMSPWIICTVLLLVCGHCLNFALAMVGAFVHPIRLTFVEFFKNLGFEWGGKPFIPFLRISPDDK